MKYIETNQNSLSEHFALDIKKVHTATLNAIISFKQDDNYLIRIAWERSDYHSIQQSCCLGKEFTLDGYTFSILAPPRKIIVDMHKELYAELKTNPSNDYRIMYYSISSRDL